MFPHSKFQNIEFGLSVFQDMTNNFTTNFCLCQHRKLELSMDILIVNECYWASLLRRGAQKKYFQNLQKSYPQRGFEFRISV